MRFIPRFEDLAIKWKLTGISMATTFIVLVLSVASFFTVDYFEERTRLLDTTLSETEITGQNCSAPLMFGDRAAALETLAAAKLHQDIVRAVLFDANDREFASYTREDAAQSHINPGALDNGWHYGDGFLTVKETLFVDHKKVGSIFMEKSLGAFYRHEMEMGALTLAILFFALPAAFFLSIRMQRYITGPISDLVVAAQRVSETRDYSVRVAGVRGDELGVLSRVFNEMLAQIEENEALLKSHAVMLEMEVKRRTEELLETNRKLILELSERKVIESKLIGAREEAESATKLKDKFVSLVSHDLRSPLASLKFGLEILSKEPTLTPANRNLIERLATTCKSQLTLINRLLDISQLQTGKIILHKRFLFARLLTEECSARLGPLCEQKQIRIKNLVSNDARLFADSILLDQCVENILSNAIKFCKEGGEITIFTPEGQPNTIGVKDDGVGIKQELLCDLFKHEVKTTTVGTNGEMGTGLGLPHCYDIMLAHNGSITVESAPGQGSAFYLNFPALRMTILAVDDQPDDLFLLKENLSSLGADIVTATNGKNALELLKTITPHIIISDLYMPEMDGMEFIAAVRQNPALKHTPVIAITTSNDRMGSESEMEVKARLFKLGASDFISKTQMTTELLPRVSRHLSM